jgi:hypothetical protein
VKSVCEIGNLTQPLLGDPGGGGYQDFNSVLIFRFYKTTCKPVPAEHYKPSLIFMDWAIRRVSNWLGFCFINTRLGYAYNQGPVM